MADLTDPSVRERLRALHERVDDGTDPESAMCWKCSVAWPCSFVSALDLVENLIAREQAAERMAHWAVYVIQGGHVENGLGALDRAVREWRALSSPEHEETSARADA